MKSTASNADVSDSSLRLSTSQFSTADTLPEQNSLASGLLPENADFPDVSVESPCRDGSQPPFSYCSGNVPVLINNKKEIPGILTSHHNEQKKEEKQKQLENDYLGISAKEEKKNIFSYGGKFCVVLFLKCFL